MPSRLLAAITDRPLLLDAAMGTRLIAQGLEIATDDPAFWNLSRPETVCETHRLDIAAGADVLVTNTFGANRAWLSRFDRGEESVEINRRAVSMARAEAGPGRFVLGSIGPAAADSAGSYRDQAKILIDAGVDGLLLETHTAARAVVGLAEIGRGPIPLLVGLFRLESLAEWSSLVESGADVVGWNCISPSSCRTFAEAARGLIDRPLLAKPSGADPNGRSNSPRSFAMAVPGLLRLGVRLIGGCCGSTEAHVAAMRSALDTNRELW